jgi:membrane protease YdiL (CAAX protease family)
MFLENALHPENKFWKYIIGTIIVIFAATIGQLPLILALTVESFASGRPFPSDEKSMLTFLNSNLSLFLLLLSFAVALLAVILVAKYLHKQSLVLLTTAREKIDWKRFFFSFSIWGIITIVSTVLMYYSNPEGFTLNFKPIPFAILVVVAVIMIPLQTSAEEYFFRGYLMQGFAVLAKNRWFPLLMTSVIFGLMHIANPEVQKMGYFVMVYYIGTGLFLGIITLMDDGMELALGFHAANNLIAALLITSDWSEFQTESILKDNSEPSAGLEILAPVFVIFPILLFIFSKKFGWKNWKERLTGKIEENNTQSI